MFKIITETADFIVIDKSAGINFHDEGNLGEGLFSQVKKQLYPHGNKELFPVHRLDKMTSGLIIFAKNLAAAQEFQKMFSKHKVEKYYLAISDKKSTKKQGLIKGDMTKSRRGTWKLLRSFKNPATTQFFSYALDNGKRLFLLKPHSGKTHQLRVALSSISTPIIGDTSYYGAIDKTSTNHTTIDRGYLHAYALRFDYLGKNYQYVLPPSQGQHFLTTDITRKLSDLTEPWVLDWPKLN